MKKKDFISFVWIVVMVTFSFQAYSQTSENKVIRLYEGIAPGSEGWDWDEVDLGGAFSYNVTTPTLTVFEADKSIATGTAVIVCPGGAFYLLATKNEGYDVAKWLNEKGITVFVLKYRLGHLSSQNFVEEFQQKQEDYEQFTKDAEVIIEKAVLDAKTAMKYVRSHSSEWGLKEDRIGIMGFSAGGTITTGLAYMYTTPQERPDFAVPVYPYYGSFKEASVPDDAPPMLIIGVSDDNYGFHKDCSLLYNNWVGAGKSTELHIYRAGGHGFGVTKKNLPVDTWTNRFMDWLLSLETEK